MRIEWISTFGQVYQSSLCTYLINQACSKLSYAAYTSMAMLTFASSANFMHAYRLHAWNFLNQRRVVIKLDIVFYNLAYLVQCFHFVFGTFALIFMDYSGKNSIIISYIFYIISLIFWLCIILYFVSSSPFFLFLNIRIYISCLSLNLYCFSLFQAMARFLR